MESSNLKCEFSCALLTRLPGPSAAQWGDNGNKEENAGDVVSIPLGAAADTFEWSLLWDGKESWMAD